MSDVVSVRYRVIDAKGELWCETSDPFEALEAAKLARKPVKYEKLVTRLVRDDWQEWNPIVPTM